MASSFANNSKKLYDKTAALITSLYFQNRLEEQEMQVLLGLLDQVYLHKANETLINALREWTKSSLDEELNQIIYQTLLHVQFDNEALLEKDAELIQDLLSYESKDTDKE